MRRAPMPFEKAFTLGAAALIPLLVFSACKQKATSATKAITNAAGDQATALVYMRRSVSSFKPTKVAAVDRAVITEASRLNLGLVHCTGANAATTLAAIENSVMPNTTSNAMMRLDSLSYNGSSLMDRSGAVIHPECTVSPQHLGGSIAVALGTYPTTQAQFDNVQLVYLAARGPYSASAPLGYRTAIYSLLSENLGAIAPLDLSLQTDRIQKLDAMYNPCVAATNSQMTAAHLSKLHLFTAQCDSHGNYVVSGNQFVSAFSELQSAVAAANQQYLAAVKAINPVSAQAVQLTLDATSSLQTYAAAIQALPPKTTTPPAPTAIVRHPSVAALTSAQGDTIQRLFGVTLDQSPDAVLSRYAVVQMPPPNHGSATAQRSASLALAGGQAKWNGWTKTAGGWSGTMTMPDGTTNSYTSTVDSAGNYLTHAYNPIGQRVQSQDTSSYYDKAAGGYYTQNINTMAEQFQATGKTNDGTSYSQNYNIADKNGVTSYQPVGNAYWSNKDGSSTIANGTYAGGTMNPDGTIKWASMDFMANSSAQPTTASTPAKTPTPVAAGSTGNTSSPSLGNSGSSGNTNVANSGASGNASTPVVANSGSSGNPSNSGSTNAGSSGSSSASTPSSSGASGNSPATTAVNGAGGPGSGTATPTANQLAGGTSAFWPPRNDSEAQADQYQNMSDYYKQEGFTPPDNSDSTVAAGASGSAAGGVDSSTPAVDASVGTPDGCGGEGDQTGCGGDATPQPTHDPSNDVNSDGCGAEGDQTGC